jgi:hypothetical protein
MAVKALRLLQPAKGANEGDGNGSGCFVRHKKTQRQDTVTNTVVTALCTKRREKKESD